MTPAASTRMSPPVPPAPVEEAWDSRPDVCSRCCADCCAIEAALVDVHADAAVGIHGDSDEGGPQPGMIGALNVDVRAAPAGVRSVTTGGLGSTSRVIVRPCHRETSTAMLAGLPHCTVLFDLPVVICRRRAPWCRTRFRCRREDSGRRAALQVPGLQVAVIGGIAAKTRMDCVRSRLTSVTVTITLQPGKRTTPAPGPSRGF